MTLFSFITAVNDFLWNGPLLILLCATHLFFTIHLHFPQKYTFRAIRLSVAPASAGHPGQTRNLSAFGTLSATLAATLGTGNIVGVSTAIAAGGPGALFWCWVTGFFGMATAYGECHLAMRFRKKREDGSLTGGPMYVLEQGLGSHFLAKFYSLCTLCAAFGVGCTTQVSAITDAAASLWQIPPYWIGLAAAVLTGLVILGGVNAIGTFCTRAVPILGCLYMGACLFLLLQNAAYLPAALSLTFQTALSPKALSGGLLGGSFLLAARYGIARGLFTNEAGIGTAALAAGSAADTSPQNQGLISMTAVFWDTIAMCTLSGLVILTNLLRHPDSVQGFTAAGLTGAAFTAFPLGGNTFLTLALIAFAVTTLIGWCHLGEKGAEYLWGFQSIRAYQFCYILMIFFGSILPMEYVWSLTDFINGIMIFPNLLSLWLLHRKILPPKVT